jgi:hypothetical protein
VNQFPFTTLQFFLTSIAMFPHLDNRGGKALEELSLAGVKAPYDGR